MRLRFVMLDTRLQSITAQSWNMRPPSSAALYLSSGGAASRMGCFCARQMIGGEAVGAKQMPSSPAIRPDQARSGTLELVEEHSLGLQLINVLTAVVPTRCNTIRNARVYLILKTSVAREQRTTTVVSLANSSANAVGHVPVQYLLPDSPICGDYSKQAFTLPSQSWIRPSILPSVVGAVSLAGPELLPLHKVDCTFRK